MEVNIGKLGPLPLETAAASQERTGLSRRRCRFPSGAAAADPEGEDPAKEAPEINVKIKRKLLIKAIIDSIIKHGYEEY